jgi:outer membrane receptor protein involved in Fe transport
MVGGIDRNQHTDALSHGVGTTDLRQALGQTVPSFSAQQFANDTAEFSLSAALRGLSPNDTLVLIDGHRRHYTGNLHVDGGNYASGSSSPDISLIPEGAIDHVEVLLEGAAAQYGTDAIAGVVNIILKNKSSGGQLSGTTGEDYSRGGKAYDVSYNMGLPLFDKGFVNVTLDSSITTIPIWAATIRATSTAWASPRRSVQWELHPMRPALSPVQAETVFLLLGLMRPAPATTIPATI